MLTRKQAAALNFIDRSIRAHGGVCPSYREISHAMGWKAQSNAHRMVESLVERGHLRRIPNRTRALDVVRQPSAFGQPATATPGRPITMQAHPNDGQDKLSKGMATTA